MAIRISGTNINPNKALCIALTNIYGIGRSTANIICKKCNIDPLYKLSQLSEEQLSSMRNYIKNNLIVDTDLRIKVTKSLNVLKLIGTYRSKRFSAGLPARGQRTRSNANTCKRCKR